MEQRDKQFWIRRTGLIATLAAISIILSFPAALYFWQAPERANALSLMVSLGCFSGIFVLVRSTWLQLLIGLPVLALNMIEIVHILAFGGLIALGGVEAILYVDPHEAREFAVDHARHIALGGGVITVFCALAFAKTRLDDVSGRARLIAGTTAGILPAVALTAILAAFGSTHDVYLPTRIVEHYTTYLGINPLTHTISGLVQTLAARKDLAALDEDWRNFKFHAERSVKPPPQELYIVVIGESSRRRNWSLYGYRRPTNPHLAGVHNLTVFKDAISPATTTSRSLPASFLLNTAGGDNPPARTKSFLSAFKETGFKTTWITNQGTHRAAIGSQIAALTAEADDIRSTNFGFWNTVLDEALLPELDAALRDPAPRKLIVLHTLGSHTNYRQRYPSVWSASKLPDTVRDAHTYSGIDASEAATVNEYDLTIVYTDWLLHQIIRAHAATRQYGAVIYFSDHGQRLYDDAGKRKGHGFGDVKNLDVEIPLLIWTSPSFNTARPEKTAVLATNAAKPVSTTNLSESMLDLADIAVAGADRSKSFFGPAYAARPRTVRTTSGGVVQYDAPAEANRHEAAD